MQPAEITAPAENTAASRPGRPRPYPAIVTDVARHGTHLVRVTFGGGELAGFRWPGPASHLKVFLPEPGGHEVELPPADENGLMVLLPGQPRPTTRTFTPLRWDEAAGRLDVEFLLHGHGPAAQWAARARPGDALAVSQPRRRYDVLPDSGWLLLAGDESALPAITTLLHVLEPTLAVQILVEVEDPGHEIDLPKHPDAELSWVPRGTGQHPGTALTDAVAAWTPPPGPGQVWAACEARAVRDIRGHLLGRHGLPSERVLTRGYWRDGHVNHPDHDYGEDAL
jgi:NADPH-dependent ferric siderophore reductase